MHSTLMKMNLFLLIVFSQIISINNEVHALENNAVLSWQANSDLDLSGYKVYTGTSPGNYSTPIDVGNTTNHTVTGLSLGTHYFAITAYDTSNNESVFSIEVSKTFSSTPAPIQSDIQTSNIQSDSATISWSTDKNANSQVEYGTTNTYGSFSTLNTAFVSTHQHTITTLTPATSYHYRVINTDSSGNTTRSANKTFISLALPDTQTPTIPTNLGTTGVSISEITLSWTPSTDNVAVTGYRIYRDGLQIATTEIPSYLDTGLTPETTYAYTVSAFDAAGNSSGQSQTLSITTNVLSDTEPPTIPTSLAASAISASALTLSWTASTDNVAVTGYRVYRDGIQIATTTNNTYTDTNLADSTTYSYTSSAFDAAGNGSLQSQALSVTTNSSQALVINNLVVKTGQVYEVVFSGLADNALTYIDRAYTYVDLPATMLGRTYIKTANSDKKKTNVDFLSFDVNQDITLLVAHDDRILSKPLWLTSFLDTEENLNIAGEQHSLWEKNFPAGTIILGGNKGVTKSSMYTLIVFKQVTAPTVDLEAPTIPTSLAVSAISASALTLSWTASTDNVAVTGYRVYRDGIQIATTINNTYTDTGLADSTTYFYTLSAFDAAGNGSVQSQALSVTTNVLSDTEAPSIPTSLENTTLSTSEITLTWTESTDNIGVLGYQIFRDSIQIATVTTNSYPDTGLTEDTTYSYTVSAFDAAGNDSGLSNTVSAKTLPNTNPGGETSIIHSIGSNGRDFARLQNWEDARDGDLINRHYFAIDQQISPFLEGELVFGTSSGAQGNYLKERDLPSNAETNMSLDNVVGLFEVGEGVIGATSGASAIINTILSNHGVIEKGEAYADGIFSNGVVINGSTTDSEHYMWLGVATSQRHQGIAGSGVIIDTTSLNHVIQIRDHYFRLEGFEITGWPNVSDNSSWEGVHVAADNAILTQLLIHDDDYGTFNNPNSDAINLNEMLSGQSVIIRNSIIYNIGRGAINYQESEDITITIENVSILNTGLTGTRADGEGGINNASNSATLILRNTISMNSGSGKDFKNTGFYGSVSNNLSSDDSAPGIDSLTGRIATEQFISILPRIEDLHLKTTSEAVDQGIDLSIDFTDDIDGNERTSPWDIGADEQ